MLDQEMKEQLRTVFEKIKNKIELVYVKSSHENQSELVDLLTQISETNPNIKVREDNAAYTELIDSKTGLSSAPAFRIYRDGNPTGVKFAGIPGGHEFTSLIVGILNAAGLGKVPDEKTQHRIKLLKGKIRLKTYISLSCDNCPEVVQSLNQMALIHSDFTHEMVDGAYFQEEIDKLSIQGVPSVIDSGQISLAEKVASNTLVHSGKTTMIDLLKKLEEYYGVNADTVKVQDKNLGEYDVLVIGGGPAGASAAIYTVRKGLKTAMIAERIGGQVTDTKGIENMISVVYTEGPQLSASIAKHLESYPIQIFDKQRVAKVEKSNSYKLTLEGGDYIFAKSIVVTTGAKWRELGVPGEKEYIGRGVAYCPHCDGPFYKGKKIAVIGGGNSGVEAAIDLAGIVREVVLIEYSDQLKADHVLVEKLKSLSNVSIILNAKTEKIVGDEHSVHALEYTDRLENVSKEIKLDGVFIQIGLIPNSGFLKGIVEMNKFGEIIVDEKGRTSAPSIYAAGDVTTTPFKQIIIAMGEGAKAGLALFEDRMRTGV